MMVAEDGKEAKRLTSTAMKIRMMHSCVGTQADATNDHSMFVTPVVHAEIEMPATAAATEAEQGSIDGS
jgi:hypothetical protein